MLYGETVVRPRLVSVVLGLGLTTSAARRFDRFEIAREG